MKRINRYIFFTLLVMLFTGLKASAQEQEVQTAETGDIILTPQPYSKNAIYKNGELVQYNLKVKNNTNELKKARISYIITTDEGKRVGIDSLKIALNGNAT